MNAISLRRVSGFVRADVCCRVVLNVLFFYSSMALVAEMSAFIIYVVRVMRDALRGGLLNPRKEV
jgi:hydrogenase maturation factor